MSTSKQLAGLLLLSTALTFPGAALAQTSAPIDAATADVTDEQPDGGGEDQAPDISVPGGEIIVTGRINRDPTRSSGQVISVLSSEEIARTGEGDIAGALGRVTGLSVVGNGLVYVRGLGDRYSLAMLNGLPLPSPEPLSRVVPLDIFPTDVIASSLVQKTYSANFPGEFGGGVINLTTMSVPDETFVKISGGISGDAKTTGADGLSYYGSSWDWTGFDSGVRDYSPELEAYLGDSLGSGVRLDDQGFDVEALAKTLTPGQFPVLQRIGELPVNFSVNLTAGTATDVGDGRLGVLVTGGISNKWRNRSIKSQFANVDLSVVAEDFTDFVTDNNILVNGMLAVGYEFGDHTVRWTNLYIRDTVKQARLSTGTDTEKPTFEFANQNTAWYERELIDTQLVGEFEFGPVSVDVRGGYAQTNREAPYNLSYSYAKTNLETDPFGAYYRLSLDRDEQVGDGISVSFSNLKEQLWFGGIDLGYEVMPDLLATVGYAFSDTDRHSQRREFLFDVSQENINPDPEGPPILLPFEVLQAIGLRQPGQVLNAATYNGFRVSLIDTAEGDPAFDAALRIHAGYGQLQWRPLDTLSIQAGVRYEDAVQSVTPLGALNTATAVSKANEYWLPGATITWEATDDLQLRVSGSRTIARPQFRELVQQRYFDPEVNRSYRGNPFLTDSELTNFEARAEYYLGGGSRASLAGFYKDIERPIEAYIAPEQGSLVTGFANAPKATLYGAEAEVQYTHDLADLGGWFANKELVVVGNYTYTKSDISVRADDLTIDRFGIERPAGLFFVDGSPLVGQSDHVGNVQLSLQNLDVLQQLTVMVNYASERVSIRGANGRPDVVEDPGFTVDIVARQGFGLFGQEAELKAEARNIFGRGHYEYQANDANRIEINTYDIDPTVALSLSVKF